MILCHQEESLWPFADSSALKDIFDELFETNNLTKVVAGVWEEAKRVNTEAKYQRTNKDLLKRYHQDDTRNFQNLLRTQKRAIYEAKKRRVERYRVNRIGKELEDGKEQRAALARQKHTAARERGKVEEAQARNQQEERQLTAQREKESKEYEEEKGQAHAFSEADASEEHVAVLEEQLAVLTRNREHYQQLYEKEKDNTKSTQREV